MIKAVIFDMFETLITHYNSPLYFSEEIISDIGNIKNDAFRKPWHEADEDRTTGKMTLEELISFILRDNGVYSEELFEKIVAKRKEAKRELFNHLHPQIIPLLDTLKEKNMLIGLITNCYSEECDAIEESQLLPYFNAVCMSYREGIMKPHKEIFFRCCERLGVETNECLYIGDGGSFELDTARKLGMKTMQAVWYLKPVIPWAERKEGFIQLENPLDVLNYI